MSSITIAILITIFAVWMYSKYVNSILAGAGKASGWLRGSDASFKTAITTLLALAGIGLVIWFIYSPPSLAGVIKLQTWWGAILILCVAGLIAVPFYSKKLGGAAPAFEWVLWGVMLTFTLLIPGFEYFREIGATARSAHSTASASTVPSGPVWTKITLPAGGKSGSIPLPFHKHPVIDRIGIETHLQYQDGDECEFTTDRYDCPSGDIPSVYFTNEGETEKTFSYSFAEKY
ncbi:MAG: hypothetical protein WAW90_01530 [Minisyncoccia bacterium]